MTHLFVRGAGISTHSLAGHWRGPRCLEGASSLREAVSRAHRAETNRNPHRAAERQASSEHELCWSGRTNFCNSVPAMRV